MKKKIETEIHSLATDLLNIKNSRSTQEWKEITIQLYEKLCVLEYLENQLDLSDETPKSQKLEAAKHIVHKTDNKEESNTSFEGKSEVAPIITSNEETTIENFEEQSEEIKVEEDSTPIYREQTATLSFEENTEITVSEKEESEINPITEVEETTTEITHITKETTVTQQPKKREADELERFASTYKTPIFGRKQPNSETNQITNNTQAIKKPKSLNDSLNRGMHIGLNDRIAFINHLFSGSTQDFNRVLSQINTMDDFDTAQNFLENQIKPDYRNWEGKEEYSERFTAIIEKKFS